MDRRHEGRGAARHSHHSYEMPARPLTPERRGPRVPAIRGFPQSKSPAGRSASPIGTGNMQEVVSHGVPLSECSSDDSEVRRHAGTYSAEPRHRQVSRGRLAAGGAGRLPLAVSCPDVPSGTLERDEEFIQQEVAVLEDQLRAEISSAAWAARQRERPAPARTQQAEASHGFALLERSAPDASQRRPRAHPGDASLRETAAQMAEAGDIAAQVAQACADLGETKRRLAWAKRRKTDLEQLLALGSGSRFCHACDVGTLSLDGLLRALGRVCAAVIRERSVPASAMLLLDEVAQALSAVAHLDPQASELAEYLTRLVSEDNGVSYHPAALSQHGDSIAWDIGK